MDLTLLQLKKILPTNTEKELAEWLPLLNELLPQYEIDTPVRVAAFLSQTGHESMDFRVLSENLNYGTNGLLTTFSKYFSKAEAVEYARKPAKIANRVYSGRMGNGDESSGDGWKFRGRGILQVTGRANYERCSKTLFSDGTLLENPDLLLQKQYALRSALEYWATNSLNAVSDKGDVSALTRRVNGGLHGLADRQTRFERALQALG
jgi:putative chitinase